eukprot:GHVN01061327.1.p1 GENE.GHVN01061327.1~~GHVN01061327.1.p1  ORF type:complete len:449 (-),score=87.10 GHVN01061327.1:157-1503(-)
MGDGAGLWDAWHGEIIGGNDELVTAKRYFQFATLRSSPFSCLSSLPWDTKKQWFSSQLDSFRVGYSVSWVDVDVERDSLLRSTYLAFRSLHPHDFHKEFKFRFVGEKALDAGGPTREFFILICQSLLNPENGLFKLSECENVSYSINPTSWVNDNHISYFEFAGRVLGKAVFERQAVDSPLDVSIFKQLLGLSVSFEDLESVDAQLHKSLKWILDTDIDACGLIEETFSYQCDEFGAQRVIELTQGGESVKVTESNKSEFVNLRALHKMKLSVLDQLKALRRGLTQVIPAAVLAVFSPEELELILNGMTKIDVADWKKHTVYGGSYDEMSEVVGWFWDVVENDFDEEDKANLLQFCTGTRRLPVEGFSGLESNRGQSSPFTVISLDLPHSPQPLSPISPHSHGETLLPKARTCFNRLMLPHYSSRAVLAKNLRLCLDFGIRGFDDGDE